MLPETVLFIPFAGNKGLLLFEDCHEKQSYLMKLICHGSYYVFEVVDKEIKKQILQLEAMKETPFLSEKKEKLLSF